ncbi:MAG: BREX-1 system phosphatase PglZ type A [Atopobiaceae bacterium]|nr:BREX-1 system phosphatase PglZ type A [Atopobiaceae bacterium]
MAEIDIKGQLRDRLSAPLEHYEHRRVIVWHDPDGEFADEFTAIMDDPSSVACPARGLRVVDAREHGSFELKRIVSREGTGQDLLLYAPWAMDLSGGALKDDWIADVELWAEHFQADWLSLLVGEMGADGAARDGFARFAEFFRAKGRRQRFLRMAPHAEDSAKVARGVIACCLGAANTGLAATVRALLDALDGGELPSMLSKFGADVALVALLRARLGYEGPLDDREALASTIALSALSCTLPESALVPKSHLIARGREEACLALWREWQDADEGWLLDLAHFVEDCAGVPFLLPGVELTDLVESDVLPCTGEEAVARLMTSIADGAERSAETLSAVARRRDLSWRDGLAPFLNALEAAARMRAFNRDHAGGFHIAKASEAWDLYVSDWCHMDSDYRHIVSAADAARRDHPEAPDSLRDALDALSDWADGLYLNWFLPSVNSCWISCAEAQWLKLGSVRDVPRQSRFWLDVVERELAGATRVAVIISDALRYEVGAELAERLSAQTKGVIRLDSMQASFPSVTEFGMAALLPHSTLELRPSEGAYPYADGILTQGTENRERVLQATLPSSRAIRAKELVNAKRADRRALVGDARVLYVYHNLIDATGEEYPTEDRVLSACSEAVDDLVSVVKALMNDLRINRVVVTADHGFLYTRRPLSETQKVSLKEIGAEVAFAGRRHAITTELPEGTTFVKLTLEYDSSTPLWGAAPREVVRIKRAGPGERYVHGGVSLQELCVPVVSVRFSDNRSKARIEQEPATLALLSTSRRVTSAIFRVDLWQKEPVGGKVLATEYDLVLEDGDGRSVSDVRRASAASGDPNDQARVLRVQLALKPGVEYSSRVPYWLVCRDAAGKVVWREEFRVEVAIAPVDDFGF